MPNSGRLSLLQSTTRENVMSEETETSLSIKSEELTGHIATTMRDWFRGQDTPWKHMRQEDQAGLLEAIQSLARRMIKDIVHTVAAADRKVIVANVDKVEFTEKGVKATLSTSRTSEYRHELADSQGLGVLITVADASIFSNGETLETDAPAGNQANMFDEDKPVFDQTRNGQDVRAA